MGITTAFPAAWNMGFDDALGSLKPCPPRNMTLPGQREAYLAGHKAAVKANRPSRASKEG
jgi:hypothetical protein